MDRLDRSRAGWNFLAQQIPMARLDRFAGPERRFSMDKWDGYEQSRTRLLQFLGTRKPSNPVTLAGDVHNNWVNDIRLNVDDPEHAQLSRPSSSARRSRRLAMAPRCLR